MFKFSLESVLDLKKNTEDMKKRELGLLTKEKEILLKQLKYMEEQKEKLLEDMRISALNIIHTPTLKHYNVYYPTIKKEQDKILIALQNVEKLLIEKQQELKEAVKERKILENLKELHFEAYMEEEKRKEQQVVDEIVTYKYARKGEEE